MNEVFFGNTPDSELKSTRQRELKGQYLQGIKDGYEVGKAELAKILDKISAEIKELTKAHCIQVMDREDIPLLTLDIIEKYKEDKE